MLGSMRPVGRHALPALLSVAVLFTAVGCGALPRPMSFGIAVEEARQPRYLSNLALLELPPADPTPPPGSARSSPGAPSPSRKRGTGATEGGAVELRKISGKHEPPPVFSGEPAPRPLPAGKTISPLAPAEPETLIEELERERPDRVTLFSIAGLRITVPYSWLADPYSPEAADFPSPYEFR